MSPLHPRVAPDVSGTVTDSLACGKAAPMVRADRSVALRAAILLASVLVATPAGAGSVNRPECRRDLAMANQLVHSVRLRENSVQPGDFDGLCRLSRT